MRSILALLLLAALGHAESLVLKNGKIYTVTGGVIEGGTIVVTDGRITAVGKNVKVPAGATVRDCTGLVIIPGLVDTHSHLGVYSRPRVAANADGNEGTAPVQSLVRAIDSIFPADPGFRQGVAGGITTANVMPGSANVMGGQTAYIKLRGRTVEDMLIDLRGGPSGMKMANGENPKRSYGRRNKAPATRMKIMALQREIFLKAINYMQKKDGPRDIALDPVVEILERKRTVHFHTHRADDIASALRLAREFKFELVLHHVTEAYLVGPQIVKAGVTCSLTLLDAPGGKPEARNIGYTNAAKAVNAGIKIALNTDDPITESRLFLRTAATAVRGGLTRDMALRALTIHPAEMMHLEKRVGSIEVGKDGDLVLLSGEPFSTYTQVLATWIEGKPVFDRNKLKDLRRQTGGYHVRERMPQKPYPPPVVSWPGRAPKGEAFRDAKTFVLRAGWLHTAAGKSLRDHAVFVEEGRIKAIMPAAQAKFPGGVPVFAAAHVTPGLIDAHASAGLSGVMNVPQDQDIEERTGPNQAALRVLDGFNPRETLLRYLLEHGVTVVQAVPGPHSPIAGQAGIFRTTGGVVRFPSAMVFNLGEAPKRGDGAPGTRMGTAAIIRKALGDASQPAREEDKEKLDLNRKALQPVLAGRLPALFVAHREDDIVTALRIIREFKLKGILSQATEGFLVADVLRGAGVSVLAAPTMQRASGMERYNTCFVNAALMADAGVSVSITSGYESYVPKTRVVLFEAQVAAAYGLGWQRALRAVTIEPAKALGIDKEHGTIEPGKVADLVCYDGDPLEYTSHVTAVFSQGTMAYRR